MIECGGVEATRSVDPKLLKNSATKLQNCVEEAANEHISLLVGLYDQPANVSYDDWRDALVKRQKKNCFLQMIGIWNKDVKRQYTVHRTQFEEDMQSDQLSVVYDENVVPSMKHCTQIVDNTTYAPIGRIALYADVLHLREIRRLLNMHHNEVTILGRCVDCFYFATTPANEVALKDRFEAEKLSTGESRFKMEKVQNPKFKVPKGPRKLVRGTL